MPCRGKYSPAVFLEKPAAVAADPGKGGQPLLSIRQSPRLRPGVGGTDLNNRDVAPGDDNVLVSSLGIAGGREKVSSLVFLPTAPWHQATVFFFCCDC